MRKLSSSSLIEIRVCWVGWRKEIEEEKFSEYTAKEEETEGAKDVGETKAMMKRRRENL